MPSSSWDKLATDLSPEEERCKCERASLCYTCRYATIVRGARLRDEIINRSVLGYRNNRVTFPVTNCTDYVGRQHPSLRDMEEAAWILRTDAKRTRVGFVPSEQLKPRDRLVLDEDQWPCLRTRPAREAESFVWRPVDPTCDSGQKKAGPVSKARPDVRLPTPDLRLPTYSIVPPPPSASSGSMRYSISRSSSMSSSVGCGGAGGGGGSSAGMRTPL